jgi:Zn-dependent alcohol dehydrogenase
MIPQYVDEYMNCEIKLDEFITHNFDLQDINQAFH